MSHKLSLFHSNLSIGDLICIGQQMSSLGVDYCKELVGKTVGFVTVSRLTRSSSGMIERMN